MRNVLIAGAGLGVAVGLAALLRPSRAAAQSSTTPAPQPAADPPSSPRPETESQPQVAEPQASTASTPATTTYTAPTSAPTYTAPPAAVPATPRDPGVARPFNQLRIYGEDTFRTPGDDVRVQLAPTSVGYRWMKDALQGIDVGSMKAWRTVRSAVRPDGLYVGEYEAIADANRGSAYVTDNQLNQALRRLSARFSNALLQTTRPY